MQNYNSKLKISFKLLVVVFSFLLLIFSLMLAKPVMATILYINPASGEYHQEDTFLVEVRIDVEDKCINVVDVNLSFSQDILKAIDFSKGDSILTIWPEAPIIDQNLGLISFAGGIPGGYCGRLPGDPERTSLLSKIVFQTHKWEHKYAQIDFLEGTQVLLNDGLGTSAEFIANGAIFTILPGILEIPIDEWQIKLAEDNIPPEPFEIKIAQDPAMFEGKYFIIFSTTDKQTGVDYFEVQEGIRDWQRAESPFLLQDQTLKSIIKVRAIDKAGNERIAEHLPVRKPFPYWLIILILVGMGIIWFIIRHRHRYTQIRTRINTNENTDSHK